MQGQLGIPRSLHQKPCCFGKITLYNAISVTAAYTFQRVFARSVSPSRARDNTYSEFNKWLVEVFNGDPAAEEIEDIAAHDSQFNYADHLPPATVGPNREGES